MDLSNNNVIHINYDGVEVLKFRELLSVENLEHAFSLKPLNFRNIEGLKDNYKTLFDALNLDYRNIVKPTQTHTNNVIIIEDKQDKERPDINLDYLNDVDALITNKKDIALVSTSADCLAILIYDEVRNVIANVHSGWRGTCQKIVAKCVQKMIDVYGCRPEDMKAFFMPSIRKCHFEVDADIMSIFQNNFGYMGEEIIDIGRIVDGVQKYNVDNVLINKNLLSEFGIEKIYDSGLCSVCYSKKIHSRRADGENFGLGTTIIMMK